MKVFVEKFPDISNSIMMTLCIVDNDMLLKFCPASTGVFVDLDPKQSLMPTQMEIRNPGNQLSFSFYRSVFCSIL